MPSPKPTPAQTDDWYLRVAEEAQKELTAHGKGIAVLKQQEEDREKLCDRCREERMGDHADHEKRIRSLEKLGASVVAWAAAGSFLGSAVVTILIQLVFK